MKHSIFIYILIIFTVFSCKTTAKPIVYDKNLPEIRKELRGINLMMRQGEFTDAAKRLEQALILYPENKDFKTVQCFLLIEQGKKQEANDLINSLISQMPANALLYTAKGILEVKNAEYDNALESFEKSISLANSGLAFPFFQKGLLHYQQKDYENASVAFFKAKQIEFRNPDYLFMYFLCQLYLTKSLEPNIHLWKSVENKTEQLPAWYYPFYIQALYDIDYKEDAGKLLDEALKKNPNDLYLQLFDCCIELDEIKSGKTVANEDLGNKIKQLMTKLACPESADAWITWLELSSDARLLAECRKYILLYSYSPLAQEWSKKLKNKD